MDEVKTWCLPYGLTVYKQYWCDIAE